MTQKTKRLMVFVLSLCVFIFLAWLWNQRFPAKAQALEPLIKELADFKARTGSYPTNVLALPAAQSISNKYSIYWGERTETNFIWDAFAVNVHDLTVLVESNYFILFAPTGRIWPISFSSFSVWRYESADAKGIRVEFTGRCWEPTGAKTDRGFIKKTAIFYPLSLTAGCARSRPSPSL